MNLKESLVALAEVSSKTEDYQLSVLINDILDVYEQSDELEDEDETE